MELSPEEAARSFAALTTSQVAMRRAIRTHRGHYYLWLGGLIWIVMAMLAEFMALRGIKLFPWIAVAGLLGSLSICFTQSAQIRMPVDQRFFRMLTAVLVFAVICPLVLGLPHDSKAIFAYISLVFMLCYIVAGIWFDIYLFRLGIAVTVLILVGLFCFPPYFWWWIAVFGGGTLIGTGFYVRYSWH